MTILLDLISKKTQLVLEKVIAFKTANFLAAVVADLLHNFASRAKNEQWSIRLGDGFYNLSRYEILLSQICRLPQSANKFEVQKKSVLIFSAFYKLHG